MLFLFIFVWSKVVFLQCIQHWLTYSFYGRSRTDYIYSTDSPRLSSTCDVFIFMIFFFLLLLYFVWCLGEHCALHKLYTPVCSLCVCCFASLFAFSLVKIQAIGQWFFFVCYPNCSKLFESKFHLKFAGLAVNGHFCKMRERYSRLESDLIICLV